MKTEKVLLGAGCFWGVQYYFDQVPGVVKTTVGYSGGKTQNPTYEDVCSHSTGHAEVTLVEFDPAKISYEKLLMQFFRMHDPTQVDGQGPDIGDQYRSAVYYFDDAQQKIVQEAKELAQANFKEPIATEISLAGEFYPAEAYHQKFAERTGRGMCHIPYQED